MHDKQLTYDIQVAHGYWQVEQTEPDKKVSGGHWVRQDAFAKYR